MGMEYYQRVGTGQKGHHCFLILSAIASQWNKGDMIFSYYQGLSTTTTTFVLTVHSSDSYFSAIR